jgi:hypothetical protein
MHPLFAGRTLAIATRHKKEIVLAGKLEHTLGVICKVPEHLDTDLLGTFTGEVERTLSPVEAAREKCLRAMQAAGCDLAIASEGSFGAHPFIPFCQANEELLLLVDVKNDLEIAATELSFETNFDGAEVKSFSELIDFADRVGFPTHALIMRPAKFINNDIVKDITTRKKLEETFLTMMQSRTSVFVETDMRAMHNPTRQGTIAKALDKLLDLINYQCPSCAAPGFGVVKVVEGLLCENCGTPTRSIQSIIRKCRKCEFELIELNPLGKKYEDPMYCDICNP